MKDQPVNQTADTARFRFELARAEFVAACHDPNIDKSEYDQKRQAHIDTQEAWLRESLGSDVHV